MVFVGKKGVCINCKVEKIVVSMGKCKKCYMKEWNNKPEIKIKKRKYEITQRKNGKYECNSDKLKEYRRRKKIRDAQRFLMGRTGEYVDFNLIKEIFDRDDWTCKYCNSKRDISLDHIIPISKKIDNRKENLITACMTCNSLKSDMDVEKFKEKYISTLL